MNHSFDPWKERPHSDWPLPGDKYQNSMILRKYQNVQRQPVQRSWSSPPPPLLVEVRRGCHVVQIYGYFPVPQKPREPLSELLIARGSWCAATILPVTTCHGSQLVSSPCLADKDVSHDGIPPTLSSLQLAQKVMNSWRRNGLRLTYLMLLALLVLRLPSHWDY